jgi:hypothetical protein
MKQIKTLAICSTAVLALLATTIGSDAQPRHRHHARYANVYPAQAYASDDVPGGIVARLTARAQNEPGLTRELAPDSRQTASGGPVGGVPGFDGY